MTSPFCTVSVIGLGYIGLPTAAVLASRGIEVIGVDIDQQTVDTINRGEIHIVEPDLAAVVQAAVTTGKLRATTKPEKADAFLVAVPTPFRDGHQPDTSYVEAAAQSISRVLSAECLVILESTSPVGTTELMSHWLAESRPDLTFPHQAGESADVQIAYCPERVLPGQIMKELIHNDRVIGGLTRRCAERAASLYQKFVEGECILTNSRTAEMCKLTENSFRDVNIAFANELSMICDGLMVNVWELIRLANRHPRVDILQPGPGVGGHCIAVDPWFIVSASPEQARLIRTAREVNESKPHYVVERVLDAAAGMEKPVVACLGLSYKPNIDDLRESPAVEIVSELNERLVGTVLAVEPHISRLPEKIAAAGAVLTTLDEALRRADIVVILVNHADFADIGEKVPTGISIIDASGLLSRNGSANLRSDSFSMAPNAQVI